MFSVVLPLFALIFAGWAARRTNVLSAQATREINRFVVYLALPALLFDIVANASWQEIWQPSFVAAFGLGAAIVFALTVTVAAHRRPGRLADATIDGLNAAYANAGFMGFPLVSAVLGPTALAPTLIATILTVTVLFAVALVLIEISLQAERRPRHLIAKVATSLGKNPLLIAPLAGLLFLATGLELPAPVERFVKLLGAAASPCALVALGMFLATRTPKAPRTPSRANRTGALVLLKLFGQPLATAALASWVFRLPAASIETAVLLAALPTGTGPFMIAEYYGREASVTSRVVLASTILSVVTITLYLSFIL